LVLFSYHHNNIEKNAKGENFSLIVMSVKGHSSLAHLLLGSVSEMVTKHAVCSILIVK
jgi:nucleotide-binding universal stress UspA family protein